MQSGPFALAVRKCSRALAPVYAKSDSGAQIRGLAYLSRRIGKQRLTCRILHRRKRPALNKKSNRTGVWALFEDPVCRRDNRERPMAISFSMIILSSQLVVAVADRVPNFDIARSCKLDIAATAGLTVDQSIKSCVRDEQKARQRLGKQWSKFPAAARANCTGQESIGGTPSY